MRPLPHYQIDYKMVSANWHHLCNITASQDTTQTDVTDVKASIDILQGK